MGLYFSHLTLFLYALYSLSLGLSLAHKVIMVNLIRSSIYNHAIYMLFTAYLVLSLAYGVFNISET